MAESRRDGVAGALLAVEEVGARAVAARLRETGEQVATDAGTLADALDAAAGAAAGVAGGLVCGAALAECADLLSRRAGDCRDEVEGVAHGMDRALTMLAEADQEVARRVGGRAG